MKKVVLVVLVVLSALLIFTGCGKKDETKNQSTNNGTNNQNNGVIGDSLYSDGSKIVFKDGETKMVFYYSEDRVTAYHAYVRYDDEQTAAAAVGVLNSDMSPNIEKCYTSGNYMVVEYKESEYGNLTVTDVRQMYSQLEELKK